MQDLQSASIVQFDHLSDEPPFKNNSKTVVLVGGCFDILHLGHVIFLERAKQLGDFLVVAVESDKFIKEVKKREPFHSQIQRAYVLAALKSVDMVVKMPYLSENQRSDGYRKLVKQISPRYIAVSENDRMIDKKKEHAGVVGAEVKVVTKILESLSSSIIAKYGAMLSD